MLSGLHTWTLTAIAIAAGVAMLWAFARCSDQALSLIHISGSDVGRGFPCEAARWKARGQPRGWAEAL